MLALGLFWASMELSIGPLGLYKVFDGTIQNSLNSDLVRDYSDFNPEFARVSKRNDIEVHKFRKSVLTVTISLDTLAYLSSIAVVLLDKKNSSRCKKIATTSFALITLLIVIKWGVLPL